MFFVGYFWWALGALISTLIVDILLLSLLLLQVNKNEDKTHILLFKQKARAEKPGMGRTWNSDPQLEPLAIPTTYDLIWFDLIWFDYRIGL